MSDPSHSDSTIGSLQDAFDTAELARRPSRPPDYEREAKALAALAEAIATDPETVLQKLADLARELCRADSSGVSILEPGGQNGVFRWRAIAGPFARHLDGAMPRDDSPCGTVLDKDATLLFERPERCFRYPAAVDLPLVEVLLAPFHAAGRPVGTVWAIHHHPERKFDAEDARLLTSLSRMASAPYQLLRERWELERQVEGRTRAEDVLRVRESQLAAETEALAKLNALSSRLWQSPELREGLEEMLAATIELLGADMGNVQILDARRGVMAIEAQRGFERNFLDVFREVSLEDPSACGRALRTGQRIMIEDVETDETYAPLRPIARDAGYRAVQSTPLIGRDGSLLGMLSTHFRAAHRPTEQQLRRLDLYARQAADYIERSRADQTLRESEEGLRLALAVGRMATWDWDIATGRVVWNDEHYRIQGYEPGEVEPSYEAWAARVHPDDRAAAEAALITARDGSGEYSHEFRTVHPDGTVRWLTARGQFFHDVHGTPIRMLGVMRDTTGRKQAEITRRAAAERQAFLLSLSDALRERSSAAAIVAISNRMLGEHLRIDRCYIARLAPEDNLGRIDSDFRRPGLQSVIGEYRLSDFPDLIRRLEDEPLVIRDLENERGISDLDKASAGSLGLAAFIAAPLRKGPRNLIRVLVVGTTVPRDWTAEDIELVGEIAERTWVAEKRANAEEALRQQEGWQRGQREALEAALNDAPLETSLGVLVRTATAALGDGTRGAFYLADGDGNSLHHLVGMSAEYAEAVDGFKIGPDSLACGLATHLGMPVITPDVMTDPLWEPWRWMARRFDYRGCWSFPIHSSAGRYVGTFAIYSRNPRKATARDLELASLMTHTASIILSRHTESEARQHAEDALRESQRELAAQLSTSQRFHALSARLLHGRDTSSVFTEVVEIVAGMLEADCASLQVLALRDGEAQKLRLLAHRGFHANSAEFWEVVNADSTSTCGRVLVTGQRTIVEDMEGSGLVTGGDLEAYRRSGIRAVMTTPLLSRSGRPLGALSAHWRRPLAPSPRQVDLFEAVARKTADLIERAQVDGDLEEKIAGSGPRCPPPAWEPGCSRSPLVAKFSMRACWPCSACLRERQSRRSSNFCSAFTPTTVIRSPRPFDGRSRKRLPSASNSEWRGRSKASAGSKIREKSFAITPAAPPI